METGVRDSLLLRNAVHKAFAYLSDLFAHVLTQPELFADKCTKPAIMRLQR